MVVGGWAAKDDVGEDMVVMGAIKTTEVGMGAVHHVRIEVGMEEETGMVGVGMEGMVGEEEVVMVIGGAGEMTGTVISVDMMIEGVVGNTFAHTVHWKALRKLNTYSVNRYLHTFQ